MNPLDNAEEALRRELTSVSNRFRADAKLTSAEAGKILPIALVNAGFLLMVEWNLPPLEYTRQLRHLASELDRRIASLAAETFEAQVGQVTEAERQDVERLEREAHEALDTLEGSPIGIKP